NSAQTGGTEEKSKAPSPRKPPGRKHRAGGQRYRGNLDDDMEGVAAQGPRGAAAGDEVEPGLGGKAENNAPGEDFARVSRLSRSAGNDGVHAEGDAEPTGSV